MCGLGKTKDFPSALQRKNPRVYLLGPWKIMGKAQSSKLLVKLSVTLGNFQWLLNAFNGIFTRCNHFINVNCYNWPFHQLFFIEKFLHLKIKQIFISIKEDLYNQELTITDMALH